MYRTDKQFMRNPATASSRIYVGNLPENIINQDLEEKFRIHGKILGLVLQKGFGFIQFETDAQAQAAIANEHGTVMNSRKINVRQALEGKNKYNNNFQQNQQYQNQQNQQQQQQQPSPVHQQQINPLFNQQQYINQQPNCNPPFQLQQQPQQSYQQQQQQQLQQHQIQQPPQSLTPCSNVSSGNTNKPPEGDMRSLSFPTQGIDGLSPDKRARRGCRGGRSKGRRVNENFRDVPYYEDQSFPAEYIPPTTVDRPERNDCEIIVVLKSLTEYAEYIEQRLKTLGLIVDLLFPNDDVPIGKVLANISSRGCLYAILVMPQNEEHRSLTLNVLHGVPQEHRNIPLEDALVLITKNFDAYMRGDRLGAPTAPNCERHPENMQMLFNLLAENRQLTTLQYDRLIKYLQDRKEVQRQQENLEGEEKRTKSDETDVVDSKQAELQSRIMNILNKTYEKISTTANTDSTPLLNDPSVQKALDSLLSGDMFKGMAGTK